MGSVKSSRLLPVSERKILQGLEDNRYTFSEPFDVVKANGVEGVTASVSVLPLENRNSQKKEIKIGKTPGSQDLVSPPFGGFDRCIHRTKQA